MIDNAAYLQVRGVCYFPGGESSREDILFGSILAVEVRHHRPLSTDDDEPCRFARDKIAAIAKSLDH